MTGDDFFLLSIAFGGFVIAPALFVWGFSYIIHRKQDVTPGPGMGRTPDPSDALSDDSGERTARPGNANDYLHRLSGTVDRRVLTYA